MRYDDPNLLDRLASEYVLGTLNAGARRRFERLLGDDERARRAAQRWEERLLPLSLSVSPVAPPAKVWAGIVARLGHATPSARPSVWAGLRLWQTLSAAFALASLVLGGLLLLQAPQPPSAVGGQISIVANAQGAPLWLVQSLPASGELRVRVVGAPPAQPGKTYELWMLPDGQAPVSLGLLPQQGERRYPMDARALATLAAAGALAVSLEPPGGSPTGQPTGPVLYTAVIVQS